MTRTFKQRKLFIRKSNADFAVSMTWNSNEILIYSSGQTSDCYIMGTAQLGWKHSKYRLEPKIYLLIVTANQKFRSVHWISISLPDIEYTSPKRKLARPNGKSNHYCFLLAKSTVENASSLFPWVESALGVYSFGQPLWQTFPTSLHQLMLLDSFRGREGGTFPELWLAYAQNSLPLGTVIIPFQRSLTFPFGKHSEISMIKRFENINNCQYNTDLLRQLQRVHFICALILL